MDAHDVKKFSEGHQEFATAEKKLRLRLIPDAIAAYRRAELQGYDPDACAGARWVCHMLLGDYGRAWEESDAIDHRGKHDPNRFWNREPFENHRVMVRCLHGLGDTLQYVRYLRCMRDRGATVVLEAQPPLKALLAQAGVADHVITWQEPEPAWDMQIEIVEMPKIFRTTLDTIPKRIPYLTAPRSNLRIQPGALHIGIVWTAGAYNPARSIPFSEISRLFGTPGCEFFSFQAGEERAQLASSDAAVRDLHCPDACVLDTASKLLNMDLLVTVDTMMAHLGGALGVPVWTLLPYEADWRWMMGRDDSPWYPGMRLFRQSSPGDWAGVIERIQNELIARAARAA